MIRFILHIGSPFFITTCLCKSHCLPQYMIFQGKKFLIRNLPISSAESSPWWNVKELCIDAVFFLLIRLSNWFLTKNLRPEIKCCISYFWHEWIVSGNHVGKHNESILRRGANFSRFFFYENMRCPFY